MKLVVDSSVLLRAYREHSDLHRRFLDGFSWLNKNGEPVFLYLCINNEIQNDYELMLRGSNVPYETKEAYDKWYQEVSHFVWNRGGELDETEKLTLDCDHPVEHALIAFACENEKLIIATRGENNIEHSRCFWEKQSVMTYLSGKGLRIIDITEAREWIDAHYVVVPRKVKGQMLANGRKLREKLGMSFNLPELITLCFDLAAPFESESIIKNGKQISIIELIAYFRRHDRLDDLLSYLYDIRPTVLWNEYFL